MGLFFRWLILFVGVMCTSAYGAEPRLAERFHAPIAPGVIDAALFDAAVLAYVNAARAEHGRRPLAADPRLAGAAAGHAAAMAQARNMAHRLPKEAGGKLTDRLARSGVRWRRAGENIAMEKVYQIVGRPIAANSAGCALTYAGTGGRVPVHSYASLARSAVARWMASEGHRRNILHRDFRITGSGFAVDPGGSGCGDVYLAQVFGG